MPKLTGMHEDRQPVCKEEGPVAVEIYDKAHGGERTHWLHGHHGLLEEPQPTKTSTTTSGTQVCVQNSRLVYLSSLLKHGTLISWFSNNINRLKAPGQH